MKQYPSYKDSGIERIGASDTCTAEYLDIKSEGTKALEQKLHKNPTTC